MTRVKRNNGRTIISDSSVKNVVAEILKLGGGEDDDNGESVQVMGAEGGQEYKKTRAANISSYIAEEYSEIVDIPES